MIDKEPMYIWIQNTSAHAKMLSHHHCWDPTGSSGGDMLNNLLE